MNVLKSFLKKRRSRSLLLLTSVSVMLLPLFLSSCGDDYDTASERDPKINVLISAATLKGWVDNGYPEDSYGHNKVVVLHVGATTEYSVGHVPGAFNVDPSNIKGTRSDGVSNTADMVSTKAQIDKVIQNAGIDGGAVIVLTSNSGSFVDLAWTYFNFRYWGFSRSKLRVLDGFVDTTWTDAGYSLDTVAPKTPETTEYSVCNLTQDTDRFRSPLEDMIKVATDDNPSTIVIDTRSAAEYNGTAGSTKASANYVAFEGHIRTALWQEYTQLLNSDGTLIGKDTLATMLENDLDLSVKSTTTAYVYSKNGQSAALTFLALDGVLNYPVRLYDGGWLEWGQMAGADKGDLAANSPWATDRTDSVASASVTYNADNAVTVDALSSYSFVDSSASSADEVNQEDALICALGGGDAGGY